MKIIKKLYLKHTKINKEQLEKILKKDIILLPKKMLKMGAIDEIKIDLNTSSSKLIIPLLKPKMSSFCRFYDAFITRCC